MSQKKQEADKPEDAKTSEAQDIGKDKETKDGAKQGLNYVFKIAPADPKNAFDFEDIADK